MIAYCGGTFDLLHPGHVAMFDWAKRTYGTVVVALNRDEFILRYKNKPTLFTYDERASILEALRSVDAVVPNTDDEDSKPTILRVQPDYIVNGSDWTRARLMKQMQLTDAFLTEYSMEISLFNSLPIHSADLKRRLASWK